jgi:hypothetical protein
MHPEKKRLYLRLAQEEGWETGVRTLTEEEKFKRVDPTCIIAEGRQFPIIHPWRIHLWFYRTKKDPVQKFAHMKAAHDFIWPIEKETWNQWAEDRFLAHCGAGNEENGGEWNYIVLAGGSGVGKSRDAAKTALLFWLAWPRERAVIVASVTLDSLETRIWGYVAKLATEAAVPLPVYLTEGKPPKIRHPMSRDKISGIFAVAIKQGDDERVISTIIGRHPKGGIIAILDECTDMPMAILKAQDNLEQGTEFFQMIGIGNSSDRTDLHGALSTPMAGWDGIDPMRDKMWRTCHRNGVCLYFNPYRSPAITDPDPMKRAQLSRFLITEEGIEAQKESKGEHSASFWRFTMGFWPKENVERTILSNRFLDEHQVFQFAEWSGFYPIKVCAGLDLAIATGQKGCVLRFAVYGHTTTGLVVLDYRNTELLYHVDVSINATKSAERQVAERVTELLVKYNCPLSALAIDCTGMGRAFGELIKLIYKEMTGKEESPFKIVSVRASAAKNAETDPSIMVIAPTDLWFDFREFILRNQVKGLDRTTIEQLTNRLTVKKPNGKIALEMKEDYKARMAAVDPKLAHSPDEADAAILCHRAAMLAFGFRLGQIRENPVRNFRDEFWRQKTMIYDRETAARLEADRKKAPYDRARLLPNFSAGVEDGLGSRRGKG